MFFNHSKNSKEILKALEQIEDYINEDINKIEQIDNKLSGVDRLVMEKIISISNKIQSKTKEDVIVFGEIMICAEKLSDGYTHDRITKGTSNNKVNYIAKTINTMSIKLHDSLSDIEKKLQEYSNQNFINPINENVFRGGELKNLAVGVEYLRKQINKQLLATYEASVILQKESAKLMAESSSLSQSTTNQAVSIEETSAAIEEITSTIKNNTEIIDKMFHFGSDVKNSINR